MDLIDFSKRHPLQDTSVEDIIEWLRSHDSDGKVHKLSIIFEDKDEKIYSRSINLKNKDYCWFLAKELSVLFNGSGSNGRSNNKE